MKTLIVYGSKHGCVEKCSKDLKNKLHGEVVIADIKKGNVPDINLFDNIIIGGSVYVGKIQKEITKFCSQNINKLKEKKIGLFICGMIDEEKGKEELNNVFTEELLSNAVAKGYFGGEVIFSKMNFFERFIIKKLCKTDKDMSNILYENINKFAQMMND
ncbi:flavodoxin domain-containing protein [Clostridium lundense]|uniref:flavodoxin domain-containing protein n=1 Tax=Clostridium lundense TaxID=319475 RepID=UPI0004844BEF|nr:flavodoxin domain-containing protein [Clostridium lundense]